MANYIVWIDSAHAKIFELHPSGVEEKVINRVEIKHHKSIEKDQNNHKNLEPFFHEVAGKLASAHQVLLVGPGEAKVHFRSHLEKHHHEQIHKKVVGIETVDHPSDAQVISLGKKFFKAHLKFE